MWFFSVKKIKIQKKNENKKTKINRLDAFQMCHNLLVLTNKKKTTTKMYSIILFVSEKKMNEIKGKKKFKRT